MNLRDWTAMVVGPPRTAYENNIYNLEITVGNNYPAEPPTGQ